MSRRNAADLLRELSSKSPATESVSVGRNDFADLLYRLYMPVLDSAGLTPKVYGAVLTVDDGLKNGVIIVRTGAGEEGELCRRCASVNCDDPRCAVLDVMES